MAKDRIIQGRFVETAVVLNPPSKDRIPHASQVTTVPHLSAPQDLLSFERFVAKSFYQTRRFQAALILKFCGTPVQHVGDLCQRDAHLGVQLDEPAPRRRGPVAHRPRPAHPRSAARGGPARAADTASSGPLRCRSGARPGAPRGFLPDTATPRGSLRPTRRSRGTPSAPALPGSGQPVPGAGGTPAGHTAHQPVDRDAGRVLAAVLPSVSLAQVAVGNRVTPVPPRRSVRAR